jgi:dTDP-4-amino-4,6-dideoxygalactose transaminase
LEDVCSRIIALAVHDDMADDDVARILASARERDSQ